MATTNDSTGVIRSVAREERRFPQPPAAQARALVNEAAYQELYRRSVDDPEGFWGDMAAKELTWQKKFKKVSEWKAPFAKWFIGGKLNVAENCLDRHCQGASGNKAASDSSFHGGSRRGGYGHGLAVDVVSVKGETRLQRFAVSEQLWKWIDAPERELGVGRPYLGRDPPHALEDLAMTAVDTVEVPKRQHGRRQAVGLKARLILVIGQVALERVDTGREVEIAHGRAAGGSTTARGRMCSRGSK